jgi:hypothetical protein
MIDSQLRETAVHLSMYTSLINTFKVPVSELVAALSSLHAVLRSVDSC